MEKLTFAVLKEEWFLNMPKGADKKHYSPYKQVPDIISKFANLLLENKTAFNFVFDRTSCEYFKNYPLLKKKYFYAFISRSGVYHLDDIEITKEDVLNLDIAKSSFKNNDKWAKLFCDLNISKDEVEKVTKKDFKLFAAEFFNSHHSTPSDKEIEYVYNNCDLAELLLFIKEEWKTTNQRLLLKAMVSKNIPINLDHIRPSCMNVLVEDGVISIQQAIDKFGLNKVVSSFCGEHNIYNKPNISIKYCDDLIKLTKTKALFKCFVNYGFDDNEKWFAEKYSEQIGEVQIKYMAERISDLAYMECYIKQINLMPNAKNWLKLNSL